MAKKKKKNNNKTNIDEIVKKIDDENDKKIEINNLKDIDNTFKNKKVKSNKLVNIISFLALASSISYFSSLLFFTNNSLNLLYDILKSIILILFTIIYFICLTTYPGKKYFKLICSSILLIIYNIFGIMINFNLINLPLYNQVDDFTGKSLTEVVKWSEANKIRLEQNYEYSDMTKEYYVIEQNVSAGTNIKKIDKLVVSVSQGSNPEKDVIVPNMVSWSDEKVLKFIKNNSLTNVEVDFVESDKVKDTLIEQSKTGSMKRNDKLKLVFSYGDSDKFEEFNLKKLIGMSKLEAEFYLKQHKFDYSIKNEFSKKIKKNCVIKQSIKAGTKIKKSDEKLDITISRGPEVSIPDLKKYSMSQITKWIIENHLKLEFKNEYDDSVSINKVISTNYKKGDKVEQGTLISVVISKGKIKMPDTKNIDEFRQWADKYEVKYQEEHEFSDSVAVGEVIGYSYKSGDAIKNGDTVIIKISDGKKIEVPNVVGMSKSDIISKLKSTGLEYSFVYKNSSSVPKDKAISQSISSGSEVGEGTTITVTLSNGKKETIQSSSSSNKNGSTPSQGGGRPAPATPTTPSCDKSKGSELNIQTGSSGDETKKMISQLNPNHKFNWNGVSACASGSATPGTVCNALDGQWKNYCDTVTITYVK